MTEEFLHYLWRNGLFYHSGLATADGEPIEVLDRGELNNNSGPDFFNSMIRMGNTIFAGNVEVHLNSSDWYRHGHHNDKAYDNVILQLVLRNDTEVKRTNGEIIPTAELRFDRRLEQNYRKLLRDEFWIPCEPYANRLDPEVLSSWLTTLVVRRLEQKAGLLMNILNQNRNSWEESFYQLIARNFGFSLNGGAFELLARSLPYLTIMRHRDNLFQMEAMFFGQAGMLGNEKGDNYFEGLKKEYCFLKRKYGLMPVENHLWRFLRLRPANFPTIRIAQFASLIYETTPLFSTVLETDDLNKLRALFRVRASEYWDTHFVFNKPAGSYVKTTGEFAVRSVIINTVVPLLFFYGQQRDRSQFIDRAINFLKELPAENNSIINKWRSIGIKAGNAFISQALLHLKNEYCSYKRCLDCGPGRQIISMR